MRAGGKKMAGSGGGAQFAEAKLAFQRHINQELEEAALLMGELNQNLRYWAEKTGELEKMAQVWGMFQSRLATLQSTVTAVDTQAGFPQT